MTDIVLYYSTSICPSSLTPLLPSQYTTSYDYRRKKVVLQVPEYIFGYQAKCRVISKLLVISCVSKDFLLSIRIGRGKMKFEDVDGGLPHKCLISSRLSSKYWIIRRYIPNHPADRLASPKEGMSRFLVKYIRDSSYIRI